MDAQSEIELARMEPNGDAAAKVPVRNAGDDMDELLQTIEAELAAQQSSADGNLELDNREFEESIRHALEGLGGEARPAARAMSEAEVAGPANEDPWATAEPVAASGEPGPLGDELAVSADELGWTLSEADWASEQPASIVEEPVAVLAEPRTAEDRVPVGEQQPVTSEPQAASASSEPIYDDTLEAVELELALQNQNLISLGFEESLHTALTEIGGEMLFQMRLEREDCQRIAAVRIGAGEQQQFALVIMPPGGGLMRVEPVEQSSNPLAIIAKSYAGLVDTFRAAA
jgi:hypothetical protein